MKEYENIVLCSYPVQFLLILDNFCTNRILNLKKVSLYKPPLTLSSIPVCRESGLAETAAVLLNGIFVKLIEKKLLLPALTLSIFQGGWKKLLLHGGSTIA